MHRLHKVILSFLLLLLTSCGTESSINPNHGFDMWDYMTSARNYEVEYDVYENNLKTDFYVETHQQLGTEYQRKSANGLTTLFLNSNQILMNEPEGNTNIIRFLHLGDTGVFQAPNIQLCSLEKFYETYQNKNSTFYNTIQIVCHLNNGSYQEFYYGYNEGIVSMYNKSNGVETEYVKVSEKVIF